MWAVAALVWESIHIPASPIVAQQRIVETLEHALSVTELWMFEGGALNSLQNLSEEVNNGGRGEQEVNGNHTIQGNREQGKFPAFFVAGFGGFCAFLLLSCCYGLFVFQLSAFF